MFWFPLLQSCSTIKRPCLSQPKPNFNNKNLNAKLSGDTEFANATKSSLGNSGGAKNVKTMFGQQQQQGVNDLLLGSGGYDPSSSSRTNGSNNGNDVSITSVNGYGNINSDGDRSSNVSSTLDLNDFPSLGGGAPSSGGSGGSNSNSNNNGLEAALRQNQLLLAHQQMMQQSGGNGNVGIGGVGNSKSSNLYRLAMSSNPGANAGSTGAAGNFNMTTEDFPALPGALPPSAGVSSLLGGSGLLDAVTQQQQRDGVGVPSSSSSVASAGNQGNSNQLGSGSGMYNIELENNSGQHGAGGREAGLLGGSGGLGSLGVMPSGGSTSASQQSNNPHQQRSGNPPSSSAPSTSAAGSALSGDYGLLGLLGVIRMSDADRNALALGSDLTSLGLNLNSSDQLYSTFASPWSDSPTTREPQYQVIKIKLSAGNDSYFYHLC